MTAAPESAADPRPGGEPFYIDVTCPDCGSELVLYDDLDPLTIWEADGFAKPPQSDAIWHDEWVCPTCLDGIHMDVPESWWEELTARAERSDFVRLDEGGT